jgi:hypothetical protein
MILPMARPRGSNRKTNTSGQLCILFLHHADDELTRFHADLIQRLNPGVPFVPLTFDRGLPQALRFEMPAVTDQWHDNDLLVYAWFLSPHRLEAERYLVVEYDTFCTVPFHEFYAHVWNKPVACARVLTPQKNPNWWWFRTIKDRSPFGENLFGMSPISGILLSRAALELIAENGLNQTYRPLLSECRIGTLVRSVHITPVLIRPDAASFITWKPLEPAGAGIWHPVKSITNPRRDYLARMSLSPAG